MQLNKLPALVALCLCLGLPVAADTLTFVAQPASAGGDNTWFNAVNWFVSDGTGNLVPAGRVPLTDDGAVITGFVDLQAGGVRLQTLVATNNSTIANGSVSVANLQLLTSSTFTNAKLFVLLTLTVGGTNCTLNASSLDMLSTALGTIQAVPPATESSLVLTQGAILQNQGLLRLMDHSQITGGGSPQCELLVMPGGVLASTNSAAIHGSSAGHILIDMSSIVRVEGGSLNFTDGIDWKCSAGVQEFQAAGANSELVFGSPFHVDGGVTTSFTGAGTNRWQAGASIDGLVQVSSIDSSTQLAGAGHLEILDSVTGAGTVHVLGTTNQGGVGSWGNGTISLPGLSIDSGANLLIDGAAGTTRQLAGSVITNFGLCTFLGGNLDFNQAATFINQAGAAVVIQTDGTFSASAGGGTFNNLGTFQKTSAGVTQLGTTNSSSAPDFNNAGLLDLRAGQLNLAGGSSSGEFRQAEGTVIWFWGGTHSLNAGVTFTGTNALKVSQGIGPANLLINNSIALNQLELGANGILDASGAQGTNSIQLGTVLSHDNGAITNGTFQVGTYQMLDQSRLSFSTVNVGSAVTVAGNSCTLQSTTMTLSPTSTSILQPSSPGSTAMLNLTEGSVIHDRGQLTLSDGAIIADTSPANKITIETGASLISTNSSLIQGDINSPLDVENHGTVRVDGGTLALGQGAAFNNSGTNEILSGTFSFQGAFQQTQGTTIISSGATLSGSSFAVLGGIVSGSGTISATVVNTAGEVSPGAALGVLSIGGGQTYQQGPFASLSVELGSTNAGTGYDQLAVSGAASLDGELAVTFVDGFVPQPGETFHVLTCSPLAGKFANISIPAVFGAAWVPRYSSTGLTLALAGNVNLASPSVSGGALNLSINTTPGINYVIQSTNELNPPNWQTASTIAGDGTTKIFTEALGQAHRFYRVLLQ